MLGPAVCFTVLDRVRSRLSDGSPADQAKADIIENNLPFAYLGALGPLLRDYTPLSPEDFQQWESTRELQDQAIQTLTADEQRRLLTLHRRVLMVAYGKLFGKVKRYWPLLTNAYALLDELDQIAEDEDLAALNARRDAIEELQDELGDEPVDLGAGEGGEGLLEELNELIVSFIPFLQSEPEPVSDGEEAEAEAAAAAALLTNPALWRESELLRWRRSGEFARNLLAHAGDDPRLRAYAYGYMVHIATAVTTEPFVNTIVGGPYRSHWWRQRLVSNFVDTWTYGYYAASASMTGDTPEPPYEDWPELCSSGLHQKIDLGLGISGLELIDAVLGDAPQPGSGDLDALASFLSETALATYPESERSLSLGPIQIEHDFTPEAFRRAYLGLSAVLWVQTSGEGPVCARDLQIVPPDDCYENPPDWVKTEEGPPMPSKHKGALAGSIFLAILAFLLSLVTGGLGAALAALVAAAGAGGAASVIFWRDLRCILYWTRYLVRSIELRTAELLVGMTFAPPSVVRLSGLGDIGGTIGPVRDTEGRPLTRTTVPDPDYPRQMDRGTREVPYAPDLGYMGYPVSAAVEGPSQRIWPTGPVSYANVAIDGGGIWGLQNGGVVAPESFPARTDAAGEPLYLGTAVDNAMQVVRADAERLANFNLDADRGYGWLAWRTTFPDLPSRPPIDPVDAG